MYVRVYVALTLRSYMTYLKPSRSRTLCLIVGDVRLYVNGDALSQLSPVFVEICRESSKPDEVDIGDKSPPGDIQLLLKYVDSLRWKSALRLTGTYTSIHNLLPLIRYQLPRVF
jgi:hypothetical protein